MGKRSRDIGMLDGSEVPEPPKVKGRVWERRIGEGKVTGSWVERVRNRGAHCGARSKRERR